MFRKLPNLLVLASLPAASSPISEYIIANFDPANYTLLVLDSSCCSASTWIGRVSGGTANIDVEGTRYTALVFPWPDVVRAARITRDALDAWLMGDQCWPDINPVWSSCWLGRWECGNAGKARLTNEDLEHDEGSYYPATLRKAGAVRLAWESRYGEALFLADVGSEPRDDRLGVGTVQFEVLRDIANITLPRWGATSALLLPHTVIRG